MSKSRCYFPPVNDRTNRAVLKARARGEAAKKWFDEGNKLTIETQPEFNRIMKETDKKFESSNQK